jgi:RNA polymerase sigma-70 factor (ECF subfamily)
VRRNSRWDFDAAAMQAGLNFTDGRIGVQRRPRANSESLRAISAAQLAEAIANGDAAAEEALVIKYAEGLRYILRREVRNGATAEDLCQETFRIVLERLRKRRLADPNKLPSFIIGVGRKLLQAHRRGSSRLLVQSGLLEDVEDAAPTPLDAAVRSDERRLLVRGIERLRVARDRELLTRCYLLEQDDQEICAALGLERSQLIKALSRARSRLRDLLERLCSPARG